MPDENGSATTPTTPPPTATSSVTGGSCPLSPARDHPISRAVDQSRVALGLPPSDPLVGGRPRDPHLLGHMSDRAAGTDTLNQQPPAMNSQPGITVGHEDLRVVQS